MANTETKVDLVINRLSQAKYDQLKAAGLLQPNQLYLTTDGITPVPNTRTINNKVLSADIVLTGEDIKVSSSDTTKINVALANKAALSDITKIYIADQISGISGYNDLSVIKLDANSYADILANNAELSNAIYIVNDEYLDAYGEQIKNVAEPTDLSDAVNKEYVDNVAGYTLQVADGVLSSGSYVYDVNDRTMTTIGINQSTTPVVVHLPAAGGKARDFILRIEISSSTAPTFTFTNATGLDFESEDADWAVMQPGVNLVSFTETKR